MSAPTETASYRLNHTMFRIKNPEISLRFYTEVIGMELINEHDAGDFKLFFLAFTQNQKGLNQSHREGILELTWNKGTEKDENYKVHNGNDQPQGFGHIAISCDNVQKAQDYLLSKGVQFKKKLEDGKMHEIAFALDPDGYWIEFIPLKF
ncbi:lactoylglutathione lyase [Ceraceosorus bombacis]|uniref:lactoylglutathione lyase n=1 Tax=Ceraceosorus bombacis TaxID=401625 RepID=A0A0P1BBQ7_9BASI|nr:lactoylglutathione lyase [Ceraceosorus bombacis]